MTEDGGKYFSPRHICAAIGLTWSGQRAKINTDSELSASRADIYLTAADGKQYEQVMLPIEHLSGWLFMVNPNKVKKSIKPALLKYRAEAFAVLDAWFRKGHRNEESGNLSAMSISPKVKGLLSKQPLYINRLIYLELTDYVTETVSVV